MVGGEKELGWIKVGCQCFVAKVRRYYYLVGGDRGIRTPDLCDANAALSQLSYIPMRFLY